LSREKEGGAVRPERQMQSFRNVLESCNLYDLGYNGAQFTWTNGQYDGNLIMERLDRAVANREWGVHFRNTEVNVLAARSSDHKPIWVQYAARSGKHNSYRRRFKFEAKWHLYGEFGKIMDEAWQGESEGVSAMQVVREKLDHCQRIFSRWSRGKYGNAENVLKKKTKRLEELQRHERRGDWEEISTLKKEIEFILEQEDIRWKQRAKQN
jgi:hypothetical protein